MCSGSPVLQNTGGSSGGLTEEVLRICTLAFSGSTGALDAGETFYMPTTYFHDHDERRGASKVFSLLGMHSNVDGDTVTTKTAFYTIFSNQLKSCPTLTLPNHDRTTL